MWIPGKVFPIVTPEDLKKHLADVHFLEAPEHLSSKELDELHKKLHDGKIHEA